LSSRSMASVSNVAGWSRFTKAHASERGPVEEKEIVCRCKIQIAGEEIESRIIVGKKVQDRL